MFEKLKNQMITRIQIIQTKNTCLKTTNIFFDSKETSYKSNSFKINVIFKLGLNDLKCVLII